MDMKKILAFVCVAALVFSGVVMADSEIDIRAETLGTTVNEAFDTDTDGATSGAFTVDYYLVATDNIELDFDDTASFPTANAAGDRSLNYASQVALADGTILKFEFTNCALKQGISYTLKALGSSAGGTAYQIVATSTDFGTDSNGNYSWIKFTIDTDSLNPVNAAFAQKDGSTASVIAAGDAIPADVALIMGQSGAGAPDDITLVLDKGLATGSDCTVAMTEAFLGSSLSAPVAAVEKLAEVQTSLTGVIQPAGSATDGEATSVIDVNASPARTAFVAEAAGDTPTTTTSACTLQVQQTAEYRLKLDATTDTIAINLAGDDTGVTKITFNGTDVTTATSTGQWDHSTNFNANDYQTAERTITITVDGTSALQTGDWDMTLKINPDTQGGVDVAEITLLNAQTAFTWSLNGYQCRIPQMNAVPGTNSYFWVANRSASDGAVTSEVLARNITDSTDITTAFTVDHGTVSAKTNRYFTAADIVSGSGGQLDDSKSYHLSLLVTVTAPAASVDVVGLQEFGGEWVYLPIYVDADNSAQWEQ